VLDLNDLPNVYARWPKYPLVSISNAQRAPMRWENWLATIPHGLPTKLLRFSRERGQYLAFLGRMSPEKRPDRAIRIAHQGGHSASDSGQS